MFCCIKALATLNSKAYIAGPGRRVMKLCIFAADIFFLVHVYEDNVTTEKKKHEIKLCKSLINSLPRGVRINQRVCLLFGRGGYDVFRLLCKSLDGFWLIFLVVCL